MMTARRDQGRAYCGRSGCDEFIGTLDPVRFPGRWVYDEDAGPPRWRRARPRGRSREHDDIDALEIKVQTMLLARFDGLDTDPITFQCPRCGAVQNLLPELSTDGVR
jgi:rubredoxin